MNPTRRLLMRSLSSLCRKPFPIPRPGPLLPPNEPADEERCPGYCSTDFYPAKPGEVLADRYQILVKVGWGTTSTVWFARDMRGNEDEPEGVVALKIANTNSHAADVARETEQYIAETDSSHRGRAVLRTSSESFEITGPEGRHVCFAYEPMREPLWLFQRRFKDEMIPLPTIKAYIYILLVGIDYLHTECKTVHTDLKLENIMVSFEDPAVMGDFMNDQFDQPMEYKIDSIGRPVYRRHNDFGPLRQLRNIIPQIVDFGHCIRLDDDSCGLYPIQPEHYRAPEVILGCGWRMSTDMWNFGVILWDLIEGKELFSQVHDEHGKYQAKAHLAEMIAFLGPPPEDLIARYRWMLDYQWSHPITTADGAIYKSCDQFFGGPFFNSDGEFLYKDLIPNRNLADTLPSLEEKERENFLSFVKSMLAWVPEERKTARELAEHPFLRLT
ncbi:kinase-like domain-containing protein [Aspergillus pseudonomiae]|uniref:Kinase-like domain-containing protein n=1 Tax=Aspergillus pseudonomiae TaxID=1506151 RepID=A0A5N7D7Y1_9EURO|nr:kinase-like domain-containing protein [Aspergillus pseudonomiae]KAE8402357.1 kinase-like domain-containing protein [Aspergillus pseudonomiae]